MSRFREQTNAYLTHESQPSSHDTSVTRHFRVLPSLATVDPESAERGRWIFFRFYCQVVNGFLIGGFSVDFELVDFFPRWILEIHRENVAVNLAVNSAVDFAFSNCRIFLSSSKSTKLKIHRESGVPKMRPDLSKSTARV